MLPCQLLELKFHFGGQNRADSVIYPVFIFVNLMYWSVVVQLESAAYSKLVEGVRVRLLWLDIPMPAERRISIGLALVADFNDSVLIIDVSCCSY